MRVAVRTIFCTLTIFIFANLAAETVKIELDNKQIQQYRGKLGLWVAVDSRAGLNAIAAKHHSSVKDVELINDKITFGTYLFVPFGEAYLKSLNERHIRRETVNSVKDEFIWPIESFERISSSFGQRNGRLHEGVDIPVPRGIPVLAVKDGTVVASSYATGGHGNSVAIRHKNNCFTVYSHNSVNFVKVGDVVKKGQIIGLVGSTGNSTGNHLHFEVRYLDIPLNPLDFLPPLR